MAWAVHRKILIGVAVLVVVALGVSAYFIFSSLIGNTANQTEDPQGSTQPITKEAYKESLKETVTDANRLAATGNKQSIKQAEEIINEQVKKAEKSQNEDYSVEAQLTKADFLSVHGRPQEALDTILTPLSEKYASNETYMTAIYGSMSLAYRWLDDLDKANEYQSKLPTQGWN